MWIEEQHTIKLLEDSFDCARAAAAGHGDVELVLVFGHCVCVCVCVWRERGREGEREYVRGSRGRCSVDVGGDGLE